MHNKPIRRRGLMAAVVAVSLAVAGCSSSADSTQSLPSSSSSSATPDSVSAAQSESESSGSGSTTVDLSDELVTPGVLTAATTATAPPLTSTNDAGEIIGFWPDMVNEMAKRLGLKAKMVQIAWDGLLPGVSAHKYDLGDGGILQTDERKASTQFVISTPILEGGVGFVVKKDSDIKGWSDLAGKKVGGTSGESEYDSAKKYLQEHDWAASSYQTFNGHTDGMLALKTGRIDAFVLEYGLASYLVTQNDTIVLGGESIAHTLQGTVYPPDRPKLAAAVDDTIKAMAADGSLAKLAKKWYGNPEIAYTDGS